MKTHYAEMTQIKVSGASLLFGVTKICGLLSFNERGSYTAGENVEVDGNNSVYYFDKGGTLTLPDGAFGSNGGRIIFVKGKGVLLKGHMMRASDGGQLTEYNIGTSSVFLIGVGGVWCIYYCG